MKYYNLIIKGGCPFCEEVISLLKKKGEQFVYTDMENCEPVLRLAKQQADHDTVPMIWEVEITERTQNTKFIGGCDNLKQYFKENT